MNEDVSKVLSSRRLQAHTHVWAHFILTSAAQLTGPSQIYQLAILVKMSKLSLMVGVTRNRATAALMVKGHAFESQPGRHLWLNEIWLADDQK